MNRHERVISTNPVIRHQEAYDRDSRHATRTLLNSPGVLDVEMRSRRLRRIAGEISRTTSKRRLSAVSKISSSGLLKPPLGTYRIIDLARIKEPK